MDIKYIRDPHICYIRNNMEQISNPNDNGPKRKKGSAAGAIAFLMVITIVIVAIVGWTMWDANRDLDMMNQGCEVKAFNQYGSPTLWSCPRDADVDMTGMQSGN